MYWTRRVLHRISDSKRCHCIVVTETINQKLPVHSLCVHSGESSYLTQWSAHPSVACDAPPPKDYFLASIASCTAMTIRANIANSTLPFPNTELSVAIAASGPTPLRTTSITLTIIVSAQLDVIQRKAILTAADKCPLKRMLRDDIVITTDLKFKQ